MFFQRAGDGFNVFEGLFFINILRQAVKRARAQFGVNDTSQTDEGFIDTLEKFKSWVDSSDKGIYYILKKSDLDNFMDGSAAIKRLKLVARTNTGDLKIRALYLIDSLRFADDE